MTLHTLIRILRYFVAISVFLLIKALILPDNTIDPIRAIPESVLSQMVLDGIIK